jgi:hypothetical protein
MIKVLFEVPSGFGKVAGRHALLSKAASGGGDQVLQRGDTPDVDDPPMGERDLLVNVAGRAQEVADLIEGPTKQRQRMKPSKS